MDERSPSGSPESRREATNRKAASLWYERFEKRRESKMNPRRQNFVRWSLIGAAFLMLLFGVQMRSDRLDRVMERGEHARPRSSAEWSARLSHDLELDGESGAIFFPLWESWLRTEEARRLERVELVGRLAELSDEKSDLNSEVDRLADRIQTLDSASVAERNHLLRDVREQLGNWRSARLQSLIEELGPRP